MPEKPAAQVEAEGLKAYEQVKAFERLRSWRLPLTYGVITLLPIINCTQLWAARSEKLFAINLVAAVAFAAIFGSHWRGLKARHAENLQRLAQWEATYGDQLPWVQVEKYFAALEQLKQELAREKPEGDSSPST